MARLISLLLIFVLLITPSAGAITLENTNAYWATGVHTDGINNDPYDQAVMLKKLGLFQGTEESFELERNMTRAEAAVMLVRFLGAEDKVLAGTWKHPFTDVPQWADKHVGWLYQSGLTKGVSKTRYGAANNITLEQYAIFLSRAISGNDNWESNGVATADEVKLWDKENGFFFRAAAVGLSTRALGLTYTRNGNYTYTMAQYLVDHGVFTPQQLLDAAWGVLPPKYLYLDNEGHIYNTIAGVTVGKTEIAHFSEMTGVDSPLPHFYACTQDESGVTLYRIDCRTMECTRIEPAEEPNDYHDWTYTYALTLNGTDYLFQHSRSAGKVNLVACQSDQFHTVLPDLKLYADSVFLRRDWNYFVTDDAVLIASQDRYYLVNRDGIICHTFPFGTQVLGFDGKNIVTQLITQENTTISRLRALDGTAADVYTVGQDMEGDSNRRTVKAEGHGRFYGEAGLYVLNSETGRLQQVTERPVLDVTFFRMDDRYIILTHDLGKRVYGANRSGGDQIVMIEHDGTERVLLSNVPEHGIAIAGFVASGMGSAVSFYSAEDVGMQHLNIYNYVLLPAYDPQNAAKLPEIVVTGYTAGRPEMESKGYQQAYIQKEQARLDALGY